MPPDRHVRPREVRALEIWLTHAEPHHGQLRRRERDEDAERVEAGEERRVTVGDELGEDDQADGKGCGDRDRLARDHGSALEPRELAWQRAVLGE